MEIYLEGNKLNLMIPYCVCNTYIFIVWLSWMVVQLTYKNNDFILNTYDDIFLLSLFCITIVHITKATRI